MATSWVIIMVPLSSISYLIALIFFVGFFIIPFPFILFVLHIVFCEEMGLSCVAFPVLFMFF